MSTDPLVARFRELGDEMTAAQAAVTRVSSERRAILLELRASGLNMQELADAVGLTRARVYRILGELPDHRKHGPPPRGATTEVNEP